MYLLNPAASISFEIWEVVGRVTEISCFIEKHFRFSKEFQFFKEKFRWPFLVINSRNCPFSQEIKKLPFTRIHFGQICLLFLKTHHFPCKISFTPVQDPLRPQPSGLTPMVESTLVILTAIAHYYWHKRHLGVEWIPLCRQQYLNSIFVVIRWRQYFGLGCQCFNKRERQGMKIRAKWTS